MKRRSVWLVVLIFGVLALTGCDRQPTASATTAAIEAPTYTGVLRVDYENALDVTSQLALGTLRLEDTANAVTAAQAAQALALWKTLQDSRSITLAEQLALAKQIEGTLTEAQVAAIVAMRLTSADAQAWLQEQGTAVGAQGGAMSAGGTGAPGQGNAPTMSESDRAAMREQFQNMTEEQRAQMRTQSGQGGERPTGGGVAAGGFNGATTGTSTMLTRAVVTLLTERGGQGVALVTPAGAETSSAEEPVVSTATATPPATVTPTPVARITLVPWRTPEPKMTPTPDVTQATTTDVSAATPANVQLVAADSPSSISPTSGELIREGALVQKADTDPGPPLMIEVTTNAAEPNPLLEGGLIYRVGGFVRNPTDETYALTAVHVTFYDQSGKQYIAHGRMKADYGCTLLGLGGACPFYVELAGQNMASFQVHPDAVVAQWNVLVGATLSAVKVADTGTGYVRISGTATNPNAYPIKNVVISALLLDESGQTVSLGTGVVTSLEAGASTNFEVYVAKKAYASYQLYVQAEQAAQ